MRFRYLLLSTLVPAALFLNPAAMADPAIPAPLLMEQAGTELDFWNSIKDSKNAEDYRSYLDRYPNGDFADLAKLRMKKYAPSAPKAAAIDPQQADIATWNAIKASKDAGDYRSYLEKYPDGEFVDLAKLRVEQLGARAAPRASAQAQGVEFAAKNAAVYAKNGGQVRAEPDPRAALVIQLTTGTELHATGRSPDGRWWRVELADGKIGYMHHSVVRDRPEQATEPTAPLPATTLPATTLPATTQPATRLPVTTSPTLPATTQPASIEPTARPARVAPGSGAP
jgi:hypothetical protein